MKALTTWLFTAVAVVIAAALLPGIAINGPDRNDRIVTLLIVAAVLGLINAFLAPVIKLLSLPLIILTLGLALLVINALMLLLAEWVTSAFAAGFVVDGFWWAVLGALIISIVVGVLNFVFPEEG